MSLPTQRPATLRFAAFLLGLGGALWSVVFTIFASVAWVQLHRGGAASAEAWRWLPYAWAPVAVVTAPFVAWRSRHAWQVAWVLLAWCPVGAAIDLWASWGTLHGGEAYLAAMLAAALPSEGVVAFLLVRGRGSLHPR